MSLITGQANDLSAKVTILEGRSDGTRPLAYPGHLDTYGEGNSNMTLQNIKTVETKSPFSH